MWIIICVVIVIEIITFFIFKKPKPSIDYLSKGTSIVVLGDSLTAGVGATTGNEFPAVLSRLIGQPIINMGVSGNTSAQGLERVPYVLEQDPKVVIVLLGGNDYLRKVPIEETFKNIDTIVAQIQEYGATVILVGIKAGPLSDPYKKHFEDIVKKRDVVYIPNILNGIIFHDDLMSDAIHPNDAGYKKVADKIYPELKKVLQN